MPIARNPYHNFNTFCIRTPVLSLHSYFALTQDDVIQEEALLAIFNNLIVKEAIYLASPELYEALKKYDSKELDQKNQKLLFSLLKYISRMTSRCTPFGLFAGCGSGTIGEKTLLQPKQATAYRRQTRFDMHYLVNFGQKLISDSTVRKKLLWYPNSSLYVAGMHYRYIEYTYIHKRRHHSIEAVSRSEYLETVLAFAKSGKTIKELATSLVDDEITRIDATDFIEELISNQLLVSELEPTVTGVDYLEHLSSSLKQLKAPQKLQDTVQKHLDVVEKVDEKMGNTPEDYIELQKGLDISSTENDHNYLFQTDLFVELTTSQLDQNWVETIKKGIVFLNKISQSNNANSNLEQFKKAFQERYEDREVALATALDIEMGIGYLQGQNASGNDPLLDELVLPPGPINPDESIAWNAITKILNHKLQVVLQEGKQELVLEDADFATQEVVWDDLPDTISSMIELVKIEKTEYVVLESAGGSGAGNLFGRFCYGDDAIQALVAEITTKEEALKPEAIHAEIVHLPESRTGNILRRPVLREYEIPYLGAASVPEKDQLLIDDLAVSMYRGQLILRSKKHQKQVRPHLTNAHNYSANSLPIYHFLCDLQTQRMRSGVGFSWGGLAFQHAFLPRVVYQNIILSKARWTFDKKSLELLQKVANHLGKLKQEVENWKAKHKLPQYLQWVEGDNTLLVNLNNYTTVQMLLHSIKNKDKVLLEEFLFDKNAIVQNESGAYANQIIVAFHKQVMSPERKEAKQQKTKTTNGY